MNGKMKRFFAVMLVVVLCLTAGCGSSSDFEIDSAAFMENLLQTIERMLAPARHHVQLCLPYSMGGMVDTLHKNATVNNVEYTGDGIEIDTILDDILYGRLKSYVKKEL